jgi:hypothetical protein
MVLREREDTLDISIGAAVYTRNGRLVGSVVDAGGRCLKLMLEGGPVIWLGRQMVEAVQDTGIVLSSNLLRKHASVHDGIHLHGGPSSA